MTTTTSNEKIGTSTAITCTLNSLGASATVGRQSTVVDNTSNLFDDALLTIIITTGTVSSPISVNVYIFGSEDGTNYDQDDGVIGATDAAYTVNGASNLRGPVTMSCPTSSKVYNKVINISSFFGGVMPRKWGFVVVNNTGGALAGSGNSASYSGINETFA